MIRRYKHTLEELANQTTFFLCDLDRSIHRIKIAHICPIGGPIKSLLGHPWELDFLVYPSRTKIYRRTEQIPSDTQHREIRRATYSYSNELQQKRGQKQERTLRDERFLSTQIFLYRDKLHGIKCSMSSMCRLPCDECCGFESNVAFEHAWAV